jgi:hypothetical protein
MNDQNHINIAEKLKDVWLEKANCTDAWKMAALASRSSRVI